MSLQFSDHNFRTRMNFAYMCDALQSYDGKVKCGSTVDRLIDGNHAYSAMWRRIEWLYEHMTDKSGILVSELSKSEFMHFCAGATSSGFTHNGKTISGEAVRAKGAEWSRRGWFRYEEKRDEKVKTARRFGIVGGLILSSFIL